jgi:hypothetical protein
MLAFTQEKKMPTVLTEQCAESAEDAASANTPRCLFVATSLATWTTANPQWFARDFQIDDRVYRRLDPEYYAWLRSRMQLAKRAATSGPLPPAAFEDLRVRFNAVHEWAVKHFGEAPLLTAVRTFRSGDYDPPVAEDEGRHVPVPGPRKTAADDISPEAMALVDAISECALSLGWKRQRLYAAGGGRMFTPERCLVCFLNAGDQIGEVTLQSIEIIHPLPSEVRHRFYNPDVDQPWVKRIASP